LISKFYENIATDTGLVVYGATETLKVLENGGLDSLIINENLDLLKITLRNK
jgi:peptide chain release factor subunit 1